MKYDLILPIGERCHTKEALKKIFPNIELNLFDALGGVSLEVVKQMFLKNYKEFLLKQNLEIKGKGDGINYYVEDSITSVRISHLFKSDIDENNSLNKYYPVLNRLKEKTISNVLKSNKILMVHATNTFCYDMHEITSFRKEIRNYYYDKKIDFLFFLYKENTSILHKKIDEIDIYTIPYHPEHRLFPQDMQIWGNMGILTECCKNHFKYIESSKYENN